MSSNATNLVEKQPGKIEAAVPEKSNTVTPLGQLGETPEYIDCPFCRRRVLTRVVKGNSDATDSAAICCCFALGLLGVWIPYVFHWYPNIDHYCSECGQQVLHRPHEGPVELKGPVPAPAQGVAQYAPVSEQKGPQLDQSLPGAQENTDSIVPQDQESGVTMSQKEGGPVAMPQKE